MTFKPALYNARFLQNPGQNDAAKYGEPEPPDPPGPDPTPPTDWHLYFNVGELWLIEECRKRPGGPLEALIAKMAGVLDAVTTDG